MIFCFLVSLSGASRVQKLVVNNMVVIEKVSRMNLTKGAKVVVGGGEVKVDLALMMAYGFNIPATCQQAQTRVKNSIENMTGLKVTDVNVRIAGITMPKA